MNKKHDFSRVQLKKNWEFNFGDLKERALWPRYMEAHQQTLAIRQAMLPRGL